VKNLNDPFLDTKNAGLGYKSKVFAGIMSKRAIVGPYLVVIGGSYSCNYRCVFCEWFSPMREKINKEILSPNYHLEIDTYERLVKELSRLGTKNILIDYLEPFMDSQLIEKIRIAKQQNMGCFIITNGSLITKEKAEALVNLKLDYLSISINAGSVETYPKIHLTETPATFERIKAMVTYIEQLKKEQQTIFPHTRLSMVVCNRNYQDIPKLVELCHATGVKRALIKKLISPTKRFAEELELTLPQEAEMKRYLGEAVKSAAQYGVSLDVEGVECAGLEKTEGLPCYYGWLFCMIDGNGDVHPCCFQNQGSSSTMGNIKCDDFSKIWFSEKYQDFRKKYKSIEERRKLGFQCFEPSCLFNNQQVYKILHEPYLLPLTYWL
jgi:radical SAM protein with 4Fe4S-binding SPASM domain